MLLQPIFSIPSSLDFHYFLHFYFSVPKTLTYEKFLWFSFQKFPNQHLHLSPPLLFFLIVEDPFFCSLFFLPSCLLPLHFLVLTSLSIRALRVLCTSSPSLSISAFKRSFCSVSSCTLRSFSCSLSLRLFLVDE